MKSSSFEAGWLRGFFDGEGHVSCRKDGRYLSICNTDLRLIECLEKYLQQMGIASSRYVEKLRPPRQTKFTVKIQQRSAIISFIRSVGSSAPAKRRKMAEILWWFRRPGQKRWLHWNQFQDVDLARLRELRAAHFGRREMSLELGVPVNTLGTYIRREGLAGHYRRGEPPTADEVRQVYWTEGLNLRDTGARFGYQTTGIRRLMVHYGIPRRREGHPFTKPSESSNGT